MQRARLSTMVWRGLRRRCAMCGGRGAFFTSWFTMSRSCRTCGLRWERGRGAFQARAGSTAVILAFVALLIVEIPLLLLTWPSVPVLLLVAVAGVLGPALVVLLYPISFTTWQAFDLAGRPPSVDDFGLDHLAADFGELHLDVDADALTD